MSPSSVLEKKKAVPVMDALDVKFIEGMPGSGKTTTAMAKVADAYAKNPNIRVFANFTVYGMKYVKLSTSQIIEYLNTGLIRDGWIVIDEAYISAGSQSSNSWLGRLFQLLGLQGRKRNLHIIVIYQTGRLAPWLIKWMNSEHIICSKQKTSCMITLDISDKDHKQKRTVTYNSKKYRQFFDTNEMVPVPESAIAKAMERAI